MKKFKVLELFSGNGDITTLLNESNLIECESVDYNPNYKATYCRNVYELEDDFLKQFDFIWLSPDCTTYSFASHGLHRRKGNVPVSDYAKECDVNNKKLFERLKRLDIPFIAENPRAFFRQNDFVKDLYRCTVYYSTYGAPYSKPTDLFSNRDIKGYFNEKVLNTGLHMDYVTNYKEFLGRCKIPKKLLIDICACITDLLLKEGGNDNGKI